MNIPFPDLTPILPEIILAAVASLVLLVELVAVRKGPIGGIGIAVALFLLYLLPYTHGETFGGHLSRMRTATGSR